MHRCIFPILFFLVLLFSFHFSSGQQFGGNPADIQWQQINTDTVRVIFPKGFEHKAQRVAGIVHGLQEKYSHSIGDTIRKINIVLHNETLISNAYVGLAPYRSEFYTTPPQNAFELGGVNWVDNLSVHEFRHVQQYSNFRKGLSKFASLVLGEEGQAVANAASIPDWFFEGDAVFNETKLTRQGRGTLPLFLATYQSLYNAGYHYSYMKMRNGSYKAYVPDHYDLGYLLVAYGRKQYGDDIWRKITDDAVRFKPLFYPLQGAVKKYTGSTFPVFVDNALAYYRQQWNAAKQEMPAPEWLTATGKNNVVSYKYPYHTSDGSLIVLKSSYHSIPAFYRLMPDKQEDKIVVRDIVADDYYSYNNGRIVYAAYKPNLRWAYREQSRITVLDLASGEEKRVGKPARYFSPDISHDGKLIATVISQSDTAQLVLIDAADGKLIRSEKQADAVYSYPKFSKDDAFLYWITRKNNGEMAIVKQTAAGGPVMELMPFTNRIIGFLQVQGDTLLFSTTYRSRDELWAIVDGREEKGPYRLASYATGLYQGTLTGDGNLVSAAFTADGYRLAGFKPLWERMEWRNELTDLYVANAYQPKDHSALDSLPARVFTVSKYPKGFNLANIHSWRPSYSQPEYSFTVYGENILNTYHSEISYTYNENEGSSKIGYSGIYGGSYLQPLLGLNQSWQRSAVLSNGTAVNWNEFSAYMGLRLPLNLTGGRQYRYLSLRSTLNTEVTKWTGAAMRLFNDRKFNYLESVLTYNGQVQQAVQHIYPRWGQTLLVQYRNVINYFTAHQLLLSGTLYLPGLASTHNLVFTAALQTRDTLQQYFFTDNFPFSRGYHNVDFPQQWKLGVNYHFPVAYPDWGFGNIVYFKRLRFNAFYDYTEGRSLRTSTLYPFGTAGGEFYLDTRWWNQQPVSFGVRYSHLLNSESSGTTNSGTWEFILPVTLFR